MKVKEILKDIKDHHEYLIKQYFDTPTISKEEAIEIASEKFDNLKNEIDRLVVDLCTAQGVAEHLKDENDLLNQMNDYLQDIINEWQKQYIALEKQYKQTKSNFKNSQTHSKNCYKKLKEKYMRGQKDFSKVQFERIKNYVLLGKER